MPGAVFSWRPAGLYAFGMSGSWMYQLPKMGGYSSSNPSFNSTPRPDCRESGAAADTRDTRGDACVARGRPPGNGDFRRSGFLLLEFPRPEHVLVIFHQNARTTELHAFHFEADPLVVAHVAL